LTSADASEAPVRIDVVPAGYRVTVTRGGRTTVLIVRRGGDSTFCTGTKCSVVAKGGGGVPAAYDPQVQHAITDYPAIFRSAQADLAVTPGPPIAPGTCFTVKPLGPSTVVPGTYCLDVKGHVTGVQHASDQLRLVSINADPTAAILTPPGQPTPAGSPSTHQPTD
jgi:hypothetical protein